MSMVAQDSLWHLLCQPNGQWLKSIKFRLPIVESDIDLCLDNESHTECVIALSKGKIDS